MEFPRLSPGQPIRSNPIVRDTSVANAVLAATAAHINGELGRGGPTIEGHPLSGNRILIRNNTGGDLDRGSLLQVSGHLLNDINIYQPIFSGEAPTETLAHDICILQNPLKVGAYGPAFVAGACPVLVNVGTGSYAYPVSGLTRGKAGVFGPLRIHQTSSGGGSGAQLLWGQFVDFPMVYGQLDGDLGVGGSATLSLYNPETNADTGDNITVYVRMIASGKEIISGSRIHASRIGGRWYAHAANVCVTSA